MALPLVRLASLDPVRGFVAVGRRMSITLAAQDLCLTQSAVSRQVQALEQMLGVALLKRGHRTVSFTPEGERLFRAADSAVQQLQDVFELLSQSKQRRPVTITASIGVASLWLLPRLGRLQQRLPGIDVRFAATDKPLDLQAEGVDLGIRYAPAARAPASAQRLFEEAIVPVAHPSLAVTQLDADTLAQHVLLEFDGARRPFLQWRDHLVSIGLADAPIRSIVRFNQYDQVIQAALAGQGIALGRVPLVRPLLAEGRLAAIGPDTNGRSTDYGYWLHQADEHPRDDVRAVAAWIVSEAESGEASGTSGL